MSNTENSICFIIANSVSRSLMYISAYACICTYVPSTQSVCPLSILKGEISIYAWKFALVGRHTVCQFPIHFSKLSFLENQYMYLVHWVGGGLDPNGHIFDPAILTHFMAKNYPKSAINGTPSHKLVWSLQNGGSYRIKFRQEVQFGIEVGHQCE